MTVSYLDHPHCPSMGAKKAQPLHNCSSAPKDKTMNRDPVCSTCLKLIQVVVQMHVWSRQKDAPVSQSLELGGL